MLNRIRFQGAELIVGDKLKLLKIISAVKGFFPFCSVKCGPRWRDRYLPSKRFSNAVVNGENAEQRAEP